jgi:hypothetical protein
MRKPTMGAKTMYPIVKALPAHPNSAALRPSPPSVRLRVSCVSIVATTWRSR